MIIPIRTEFENFLSFKDKQEFHYSNDGIHYIYGINNDVIPKYGMSSEHYNVGCGKSSLAMLMQFAFYGKVQKNINKDNIINKDTKKNLYVQFDFMSNDTMYRIERYRKHTKHKNRLYLYKKINEEFEDISGVDNDHTQDEINKLIVLDINTFEKSILFTREDKTQFLELSTLERGNIFENIVQLNKLKDYLDKVKKQYKSNEEELEIFNNKIITLGTLIKRDIQYIKELKDNVKHTKDAVLAELGALEKKIKDITSLDLPIEVIIDKLDTRDKLIAEQKKICQELNDCKQIRDTHQNTLENAQSSVQSFEKDIQNVLRRIKELIPIKCHKCGAIQNEDAFVAEQQRLQKVLEDLNERLKSETIRIASEEALIKSFEKQIAIHEKRYNDIGDELKDIPNITTSIDDIFELQNELKLKQDEYSKIKPPIEITQLKNEINKNAALLKEEKVKKEKITSQQKMLQFWMNALDFKSESSIKQYIISKIIPIFNNLLQQILEIVYDGDMIIMFDNFFRETILYNGREFEYNELSTGEKTKLNFCINLSIFDLTRINLDGCSVIFLDEIFVHVDSITIKIFLDIIKERYAKTNAVYIISHSETVKEICDAITTTRIDKRDGASFITIE